MYDYEDVIGTAADLKSVKDEQKEFAWTDSANPEREVMSTKDAQLLMAGVNITTLSRIFRKSPDTVKEAVRALQPIRFGNNGHPYYDIGEAAEFLVIGKRDLSSILKNLDPEDLPETLRTSFWDAKLKRQKFEENAKELWNTDQVLSCISTMFMTIKTSTQLFVDSIDKTAKLSDKQREILETLITDMMEQCREDLKQNVKESQTRCTLKDIDNV